jgi:alpha-beta hydrolase superfamily lysophospholipase
MRIVSFLLVILLLIILGLFLYTLYRLHEQLNFHSPAAKVDLPEGWDFQTQFVITVDHQKIAYWYFPVENSKGVVILIHGYSNPGGKTQMMSHARYLHDAGYSTVVLDLRAFGESDGNKITLGVNEWKDVDAVFDAIKALPENKDKKVGLLGISMGASTALVHAGITHKPDFVIASVPYADFDSLFHFQIQHAGFPSQLIYPFMQLSAILELGKDYAQFTPKTVIKDIHVPVLLISAKQDDTVNSKDAVELYSLANQPKELWEIDSPHDIFDSHPEEFKTRVLEFLGKYSLPQR